MPRRLNLVWPDPAAFRDRDGTPIRLLAVSDQLDPGLVDARNRRAFGPIDLVIGCGDMPAHDLGFIADALNAPLLYVRGNHDAGERWAAEADAVPEPVGPAELRHGAGLAVAGLPWPGRMGPAARRSESGAWRQALRLSMRRLGSGEPLVVVSHMPPRDAGDIATDAFHRGSRAYRWLLDRLAPPLWLHGHTPLAAVPEWQIRHGPTTLVNVTGAVLVELSPPG